MEVYTREFLQKYKQDAVAYGLAKKIVQGVLQHAQQGLTRYLYPNANMGIEFSETHQRNANERCQVVVGILKKMLPDSLVEYKTVVRLDGTAESGIIIDWS